jgi:hypothetical protein
VEPAVSIATFKALSFSASSRSFQEESRLLGLAVEITPNGAREVSFDLADFYHNAKALICCESARISDEATAETYSMVGRSLPLTLLSDWEKYRLRWDADDGREEFRLHICRARCFEKQD